MELSSLPSSPEFMRWMSETTFRKTIGPGMENARANRPFIEKTIRDLARELSGKDAKPALVVSAGPSLHKTRALNLVKEVGFSGYVVCADGALGHCLRNNIVPDFVLSVDPDPHRIIRWFGDPRLDQRPEDDYFTRQDLDPYLNEDEVNKNRELIQLVNKSGKHIKAVLATSISPEIPARCRDAGMTIYWWNPLYDDFEDPNSHSRTLYRETGAPCMTTGGNIGSSSWAFVQAVLKSDPVLMVGMDFSYPPETEVQKTQYYDVLKAINPVAPEKGLIEVYNPYLKETWLTDPPYYWYRLCFLEMLEAAQGKTLNCSEGGILFGPGVEWRSFREVLEALKAG